MPTVNVVLATLVMDGAWPTVKSKLCVAVGLTPLAAMNFTQVGAADVARRRAAEDARAGVEGDAGRQTPATSLRSAAG